MAQPITVHRMLEIVNEHSHLALLPELTAAVAASHLEALLAQTRHQEPLRLTRHRGRVFSQDGSDGIIAEILTRIEPPPRREFLEIGAGTGIENNTRLWLELGWSGIWIEADAKNCALIRSQFAEPLASGQLRLIEGMVTAENVADALHGAGCPRDLGLLSLDIDMNTSHVWKRLADWRPAVAVIEYNPAYPPSVSWEVPYDPAAVWARDNRFGASLKRLEDIGDDLGYCLVGCDVAGINAFFVRADLAAPDLFHFPVTAENHYEPPRFTLLRVAGHAPAVRPELVIAHEAIEGKAA